MTARARPTATVTTTDTKVAEGTTTGPITGGTPPDSADLDVDGGVHGDDHDDQPTTRKMPRARHEIVTGPDEGDKIAPGTFITDKVAKNHGLDDEAGKRLVASGAIELVDVQAA